MGHPEHDLLFIATQVARAAGLKVPSQQASRHARIVGHQGALQLGSIQIVEALESPKGVQKTSWLFTEAATYQMLLRGHAPASDPFRKWVTEVVLPSIRKTGKFEKTLDLIRGSPMMATLSPAPLVRAPRPKATGSPT